jgi:hypothetical protein
LSTRRFPPPRTIEEHNNACFIVKDATGQVSAAGGPENWTQGRTGIRRPHGRGRRGADGGDESGDIRTKRELKFASCGARGLFTRQARGY